jgi:hypothetical protein
LIEDLSNEDYGIREQASDSLALWDVRVAAYLRSRHEATTDPEVRSRLAQVIRCIPDVRVDNRVLATTGAALLVYFGAGYTHLSKDRFDQLCLGEQVRRSLDTLSKLQRDDGMIARPDEPDAILAQVLLTFALCEAYSLTTSLKIKPSAEKALRATIGLQDKNGAWGDDPAATLFAIMTLKSAECAELDGYRKSLEKLEPWIRSHRGNRDTCTRAAVALYYLNLGRRGDPRVRDASEQLLERCEREGDSWGALEWYVTACLQFQFDGPSGRFWKRFNGKLATRRAALQIKEDSCGYGGWAPISERDKRFGMAWCSALQTLIFQVYTIYPSSHGVIIHP